MADTAARHRRVAAVVEEKVLEVLRSGRYVDGPVVEEVQRRLSHLFGWKFGVGVNSGTDALSYALMAIGVRPGQEVVVPAVTFFASAGAVARIGAIPVIADIRADLPLLDPAQIPIGPNTAAVMAVHLYGEACRLGSMPVPVVDDTAQCAGANPPIREGVIAGVSFYPTKTLGAAGDSGMVFCDDPEWAHRLSRLNHHGMPSAYLHEKVGGHVGANSRMDAMQAAVLLAHLQDLEARVSIRRQHASLYDSHLPSWVQRLPRWEGHPVHQYVVRVPHRDRLRQHLSDHGIESAIYYPIPLSKQPALSDFPRLPTPNADHFCAESLALPVHECLEENALPRILDCFRSFAV